MKIGMSLGMRGQRGLSQIQRAIAFLRRLGTSAHVWAPGANGVSVASLPSNNYLLSDGSTGYSAVDGVDGLTLDAMGSLGSELVTNGDFSNGSTGWLVGTGVVTGGALSYTSVAANSLSSYQAGRSFVSGTTYLVEYDYSTTGGGVLYLTLGGVSNFATTLTGVGHYRGFFKATASNTQLDIGTWVSAGTVTGTIDNISVKEYTGTHLTQATTANKPLVRRGMYNLLSYSTDFANVNWVVAVGASKVGVTTIDGVACMEIANTASSIASMETGVPTVTGVDFTLYALIRAKAPNCYLRARPPGGTYGADTLIPETWTLVVIPMPIASAPAGISIRNGSDAIARNYYVAAIGFSYGTWTAAQILAEGGIPTTTTTAASNPSAGKYWWSLDGSNDSLLSGNLGITTACTIVMSLRVNNLAATQIIFAEDTNGVQVSIATDGSVSLTKVGGAALVTTAAGVVVAGVPLVLTARLSAGNADIRKSGAQSATAASALTFSAVTGARVGTAFNGTTSPTGGALGWVVPSAVGLSDADCLTVERLAGAQFPGMATF